MKRLLLIVISVFIVAQAFAGTMEKWYEGSIVLADETVLTGSIALNPVYDLILVRRSDSVRVYPAHKIRAFYYYDPEANINRKFVSIKDNGIAFRACHLYEVVVTGSLSVLRRQKNRQEPRSDKDDYEYYIPIDNNLIVLAHFRKHVYSRILDTLPEQASYYVRECRLNPDHPADAIKIIMFYNQAVKANSFANL